MLLPVGDPGDADRVWIWFARADIADVDHVLMVHTMGRDGVPPLMRPLMALDRRIAVGWTSIATDAAEALDCRAVLREFECVRVDRLEDLQ